MTASKLLAPNNLLSANPSAPRIAFFVAADGAWNRLSFSKTSCRPAFSTILLRLLLPCSPGVSTPAGSPSPGLDQDQARGIHIILNIGHYDWVRPHISLLPHYPTHEIFDAGLCANKAVQVIRVVISDNVEFILPARSLFKLAGFRGRPLSLAS